MPVSLPASAEIISTPLLESPWIASSNISVSLQPVIAVSGVLSSCDTEEMNSDWVLPASPIFTDMSLNASTNRPISSSRSFSASEP